MFYLLFGLIAMVIILFVTANMQVSAYSTKFECFTLSSIGTIRDKIKLPTRNRIITAVKTRMNKKKEIEDVQIVDPVDLYQYLD